MEKVVVNIIATLRITIVTCKKVLGKHHGSKCPGAGVLLQREPLGVWILLSPHPRALLRGYQVPGQSKPPESRRQGSPPRGSQPPRSLQAAPPFAPPPRAPIRPRGRPWERRASPRACASPTSCRGTPRPPSEARLRTPRRMRLRSAAWAGWEARVEKSRSKFGEREKSASDLGIRKRGGGKREGRSVWGAPRLKGSPRRRRGANSRRKMASKESKRPCGAARAGRRGAAGVRGRGTRRRKARIGVRSRGRGRARGSARASRGLRGTGLRRGGLRALPEPGVGPRVGPPSRHPPLPPPPSGGGAP
ncbi:hypothetical protein J1605_015112 [Eschrichtius robustus]|uniref:Uncharacterized protein n=1 Tax=Eschrichtius robustus TaxID=9764 RepID=A0AB34GAV5_ESCRO|nr:hypothetical protein J1605_015112 [Eschrichtius robustus]